MLQMGDAVPGWLPGHHSRERKRSSRLTSAAMIWSTEGCVAPPTKPAPGGMARLVAESALIATLPDDVVRTSPRRLVTAPPPVPIPPVPMLLLWHPRDTTDARHRFVRERVAEAIQSALGAR